MKFLVIVPASADSEAGLMPSTEEFAHMGAFNEQMVEAGIMLAAEGLQPTSKGARIRFGDGGKTIVRDGPFTDAKELVAGFWIIQVKSKDEAVAWMQRAPFPAGTELEIRQIFETEDFGDELTPELRAQEERHRAAIADRA